MKCLLLFSYFAVEPYFMEVAFIVTVPENKFGEVIQQVLIMAGYMVNISDSCIFISR